MATDNGSKPPIGYLPPKAARTAPRPASAEGGILDALILIAFATYELPVAMLTRTHKGARYARLLRLLLGLFVGSFAYSAGDPLAETFGIVAKLGRDARTPTGPNLYFVLSLLSLGAYAVALARRWGRERRREFVHSQFVGFPRFLPLSYVSYVIEPAAVAAFGAVLIVTRVSYPFGAVSWQRGRGDARAVRREHGAAARPDPGPARLRTGSARLAAR